MKARHIAICLVACATATALMGTGTAEAKRGYFVEPAGIRLKMVLHGSHGYRISVSSFGHRLVLLSALKGGVSAEYVVRGHASRHGIYANFGKLGRIAVRFDGSRRPLGPSRPLFKCKGEPAIHEVGRFEGTIRFNGELGFTSVSARRAKGSVVRSFRRVCKRPPWLRPAAHFSRGNQPEKPSVTIFAEASRTKNRTIFLQTLSAEIPGRSGRDSVFLGFDVAGLQERRGRIAINRTAFIEGRPGDVLAGDSRVEPTSGTIAPPRPFSGTATYSKAAEAEATLTGSLTVWLPGADRVPLTGPDFRAALCRTIKEKRLNRCMREVADELGPELASIVSARPQGSGSQSQAFWDARLSLSR
jgi:hypothetical protein